MNIKFNFKNKYYLYFILLIIFYFFLNYKRLYLNTFNLEWFFIELINFFNKKNYYFNNDLFQNNQANSVIYPYLLGTFNILKIASRMNAKLIFLSSSRIYSILKIKKLSKLKKSNLFKKFTVNEEFSTEAPLSFYGYSKLSSEMMIKEFSYLKNIDYIINRFGLVAGPGQFGKIDQGVISYWVWRKLNKLKLYYKGYKGSGMQIRDVLHIDDLTCIIGEQVKKIDKIKNNVFNIGGGTKNSLTLKELNDKISNITNNKQKILKKLETSNYDIPIYISNNSKIKKFTIGNQSTI